MRILFYTFSFPPKVDGVTARVLNTLRHLIIDGHTIRVATPQQPVEIPDWLSAAGVQVDSWAGVRMPMYREQWMGNPLDPRVWAQMVRSLRGFRPDLVHLVGPDPGHWATTAICSALGIPVVVSYHTDMMSYARRYRIPVHALRLLQAGYRWSWIERVITTSPSFRQKLLSEHGIRCDAVWPPGVDGDVFQPRSADPSLRARLTLGRPERFLFIYAGRFSKEKDLEGMLRILEPFQDVAVALIGNGPDQSFRRHNLGDRVYVSDGFWPQLAVAQAHACADAFITASCTETCGFSVLEAMACGLPIVAPAAQGLVDLVRDGDQGLLFAPGDVEDARRQVRRLLVDRALQRQLREQARSRAAQLTWESATRWLVSLYREVLRARGSADLRRAPA